MKENYLEEAKPELEDSKSWRMSAGVPPNRSGQVDDDAKK